MIRLILLTLIQALGFNQTPYKADLRKKQEKQINKEILYIIGIIIFAIIFFEIVFLAQGTESGLVRNNLNNI